jgi:hypothetical protein
MAQPVEKGEAGRDFRLATETAAGKGRTGNLAQKPAIYQPLPRLVSFPKPSKCFENGRGRAATIHTFPGCSNTRLLREAKRVPVVENGRLQQQSLNLAKVDWSSFPVAIVSINIATSDDLGFGISNLSWLLATG